MLTNVDGSQIKPGSVTGDKLTPDAVSGSLGFDVQPLLQSGVNIKTIGGNSLLGSGNIVPGVTVGQVFFMSK